MSSGDPQNDLPFVSVIIPTRNEEGYLRACLDSLLTGSYPMERMEILVVDGLSDDRTPEIVQEFTQRYSAVKLLENPARAVPNAMNVGIRAARGEFIVRVDAHAHYGPDYVLQLISWLRKLDADNVGGVCIARPASEQPEARAVALIASHPFGLGGAAFRLGSAPEPMQVDTVPFGCYPRQVFDRIGLFDEALVRNQDDELNGRLVKAGGRIFLVPQIKIDHYQRPSLRKMGLMLYQYGYFKPLVAIKLGHPATWRQLAPPVFTGALLGLPLAFFFFPWTALVWAAVFGTHTAANVAVSLAQSSRHGRRLFPYLLRGHLIAHLSYGFGYLRGMADFVLLRRHLSKARIDVPISR